MEVGTGAANRRAWAKAAALSDGHCFWCRLPFTLQRPPTEDHKVPIGRGGTKADGVVLCCQSCNSARGMTEFDEYLAAVEEEHERARVQRREFRRPRYRLVGGEWHLGAQTRAELRELRAAAE